VESTNGSDDSELIGDESKAISKTGGETGKSDRIREVFLAIVLVLQVAIIILCLIRFSRQENQQIMSLETSIEKGQFTDPDDFILGRYDMLETVTLLTGTEDDGRSKENKLREKMSFEPGQAMWILQEDRVNDKDNILKYSKGAMGKKDFANFKKKLKSDEIINILYDLGAAEDTYRTNWRGVGVNELKSAPFLPWKKKVDFVVLSSFNSKHVGGLAYILKYNPATPIFCPPLKKADLVKNPRIFERAHNLIPILPGYTKLTSKLGTYVTEMKQAGGKESKYELDLILHLDNGVAVIAGAGLMEPLELVKNVKKATGKEVLYYIGGTNLLVGLETEQLKNQMRELAEIAPKMELYPNYNTSMIARRMLKDIFGEMYHETPLALKIRLKKKIGSNRKGEDGKQKTSKTIE